MFKKLFFWTSALILTHQSQAQSASGSWYGKADVAAQGSYSNYLTELVLQQKGNEVEGVFGYYFKDTYQSFFVRGKFNKATREVTIPNLPMLLYASTARNGIECPMSFVGKLMVSQAKSTLNGSFYANDKYKYTCPELKVTFTMDRTESTATDVLRNMAVGQRFWKPQEEDVVVETKKEEPVVIVEKKQDSENTLIAKKADEAVKTEIKKTLTKEEETAQKQAELIKDGELAKKEAEAVVKETVAERKPVVPSVSTPRVDVPVTRTLSPAENNATKITITPKLEESLTEAFKKRKNIYSKDLEVDSDSIRITFYDNGDIDGDSISVFLNGAPVLANQMITDRGTNIYVKLDSMKAVNEISMFAQNLGTYPPNTALMVVTDGSTRYEVYLSSSLSQNATVRLVRKKRQDDPHRLRLK
ncbi:cell envelope integrity protein TolA [Pseudoflavitalea rhizosphaerae]|uniref:cell envelope integrity protein TolA n=1 Tax=Pseudoflavitalea rhizosphaerae TaxID=1884793 RepID=UPI000F8C85B2|nr:cell envelope integrity protein TolA [Pseudoflavitalea rhizosphaerae]